MCKYTFVSKYYRIYKLDYTIPFKFRYFSYYQHRSDSPQTTPDASRPLCYICFFSLVWRFCSNSAVLQESTNEFQKRIHGWKSTRTFYEIIYTCERNISYGKNFHFVIYTEHLWNEILTSMVILCALLFN